jgi:hypothetical protein
LIFSEKRSGSLTMKLRYWSYIWARCSAVPEAAVCAANSSKSGRGIELRKFTYAGEYSDLERSDVTMARLAAVGSIRYMTGTYYG